MSRSTHAVELCTLLVEQTYGELTSRIFAALLRRGRLTISGIHTYTSLPNRQIRHGLAVLIQQNLLYHFRDEFDPRTFYEANHDAAYSLVRTGKIVELVEERFGAIGKELVQDLLFLGLSSVSDLQAAYDSKHQVHANGEGQKPNGASHVNGVNGMNGFHGNNCNSSSAEAELHSVLALLLQSGFVERVNERMFRSPTELQNLVEKGLVRNNFGGQIKGTKQKEELKLNIRQQLKSWRDEDRGWRPESSSRAVNGINGHSKKRRLSEAASNGDHAFQDTGFRLEQKLVVRINYEKCTVALRNKQLVELVDRKIGKTTSVIYAEILKVLEEKIPRCRVDPAIDDLDDAPNPSITTTALSMALGKSIDVTEGIGDPNRLSMEKAEKSPKGKKADADDVDMEVDADEDTEMNGSRDAVGADLAGDGDDHFGEEARPAKRSKVTFQEKLPKPNQRHDILDDRELRAQCLKMHLQLLAQDSCQFIHKSGQGGSSEWTVDFERMVEHLRESEVDSILLENFGQGGLRLVRMLRKLGKVDEKNFPNLALMKMKDIRTKMAEMQMAGMIDIQEVPRDAGRTVARTMFLWHFDPDRVYSILLDKVYKSMSRCLQRLEFEKREAGGILAIMERTDVRQADESGVLAEVMDQTQLDMLNAIRRKEDMILGQIARLDELVGIFRDY